jgi:hypothetical protein
VSTHIVTPLKTASDSWRLAFPLDAAPTNDPAEVQPLLRQINGEYVTAGDHLRELPRHLDREFAHVSAMLSANGADAAAVREIEHALAALERTLAAAIDDPATSAAGITDRTRRAATGLGSGLRQRQWRQRFRRPEESEGARLPRRG